MHKPPARRVAKIVIVTAVVGILSTTVGRVWLFGLIGVLLAAAAVVHGWWLPKHGVNGWTGEPRERYLELIKARRR